MYAEGENINIQITFEIPVNSHSLLKTINVIVKNSVFEININCFNLKRSVLP